MIVKLFTSYEGLCKASGSKFFASTAESSVYPFEIYINHSQIAGFDRGDVEVIMLNQTKELLFKVNAIQEQIINNFTDDVLEKLSEKFLAQEKPSGGI